MTSMHGQRARISRPEPKPPPGVPPRQPPAVSASYRIFDDNWSPEAARVEVVTGVVTEYGHLHGSGYLLRGPEAERFYPLAEWIEDKRDNGGRVFRRRVIVVEDWTEVTGP